MLFICRNGSLKTAYQLKKKSPYSKLNVINQASSSSYQTLGYQPIGSERQLGNMDMDIIMENSIIVENVYRFRGRPTIAFRDP